MTKEPQGVTALNADRMQEIGWPEDWPGDNGEYLGKCRSCGESFLGHKRRLTCKPCSTKEPQMTEFLTDEMIQAGESVWRDLILEYGNEGPIVEMITAIYLAMLSLSPELKSIKAARAEERENIALHAEHWTESDREAWISFAEWIRNGASS